MRRTKQYSILTVAAFFALLLNGSCSAFLLAPLNTRVHQDPSQQVINALRLASPSARRYASLADHQVDNTDPISSLKEGKLPRFTWPVAKDKTTSTTVDVAALAEARLDPTRFTSVTKIWDLLAQYCGHNTMLVDPSHGGGEPLTLSFSQARMLINQAAAGFNALGLKKGDHVSLLSENSARWLLADQACARQGICTAVRGASAPLDELQYIYEQSDSKAVIVQDTSLLKKLEIAGWLESKHGKPSLVIVLRPDEKEDLSALTGVPILSFEDVLTIGAQQVQSYRPPEVRSSDLLTLVYTSGTTARPKAVMLSNGNIMHQMKHINLDSTLKLNPGPGDVILSLLPCWHIFERSAELFALSRGASLVYSSVVKFKQDLHTYKPHFLIVVPRLLESVHKSIKDKFAAQPKTKRRLVAVLNAICLLYTRAIRRAKGLVVRRRFKHNPVARLLSSLIALCLWPLAKLADVIVWKKVRDALGGRQKLIISGGSSLAKYLEEFFQAAGIPVISGYGLSETSPVIAVRRADRNLADGGVVGLPPAEVELQIRDIETGKPLPNGKSGVVFTKGPQVMMGYYKNLEATKQAIDPDGWFNTGDLGFINQGSLDLVLTGRLKDLIVLNNGENVEPQPIEDAIMERCPLVDQVMVVGQDQKALGALVVVNPRELAERGLISKEEVSRLDSMVGPTAVLNGCRASTKELAFEAEKLNANKQIVQAVLKEISTALTSEHEEFRQWELVKTIALLLSPFNVPSGLLTQTLKIKRSEVAKRYNEQLKAMYNVK